ncbi:MAG: formate/nitrite transporter family protein, partial [Planctomycetota bacterium]
NFAPTGSALVVRWGDLHSEPLPATFVSSDKVLAVIFPITAFVAVGGEHSIANWFFLPYGYALDGGLDLAGAAMNLVAVTLGNIVGGTLLVAGVYWLAYLRHGEAAEPPQGDGA